ncbi:uncharacterized protein LOC116939926 isoform X2 [Petromyzon marinus]|uniref:uncharacterized protein LOC116939926 isoform X2 n=1 Tax=Petromyzon marinus TaxID=7757 RepID=UPI003F70F910
MGLRLILQLSLCMLSVARSQQAVCTTWGGGFFKTFDEAFFKFSSNCSYMFFQDCRSSYEEFNIKISHGANEQFSEILFKIDTDVAQFANGKVSFNNRILTLPFSNNKILIQTHGSGVKLAFRQLEISAYLNDDAFTVVAGDEFRQQLCGLCGNFDGSSTVTTSYTLPAIQQYLIQPKSSGKCTAVVTSSCKDEKIQTFCRRTLNGIGSCGLNQEGYAAMCAIEKCQCGSATTCGCAALSAYSRECSLQYKPLPNWRSSQMCPPQDCPGNLEYQECGSTCPPTCANMDPSKCQEPCVAGCVCPSGTVLSAINEETCIAPEECRCNYNGITYDASDKITIDCNSCTCEAGSWTCTTRLCPKACSLESGAHFNTFDSRSYTFHGVCSYYLAVGDDWSVEVLLTSCPTGLVDRTCLDSIYLKTPMRSLEFKSNGKIISSQMSVSLPYISDSVKIFRKSSMFIQVDTSYGMMMLVQNSPTMQVYIGLIDSVMFRETGLCGNFNGIASDDFMSSQGLVEGTAAAFANSWKVNPDCEDVGTVIRDPCQLNTAVAKQAELRCAILRNSTAFFKDCHYLVDPYSYYSRCKQDACSCPSGQDCITETFLSYALACASKGLVFENWRKATDSQLVECPNAEVYSYNANACNQTCRSLSSVDLACQESGLVAEGCQCAEGLFANDEGMCVPAVSCPCYVNGDILKPGEKVTIADIPCYCREGQLLCSESKKEECTSPMVYVDCITSTYGKACESSCAIQTPLCLGRQCQPGCICPEGLINNGNGDCVNKEECPCQHNGLSYTPGDTIKVDCNKCKCYSGSWNCTELQCDSTCKMYGDGHYTTFDGQRFQFDGNCEYVVAQDFCVSDPKVGTFQIITENIPCGSMSTCSKSIRFFLQNKEIKLADGKYEIHDVSGSASKGSEEVFTVHTVGLYLIVKASNGIKLIWDRRTSLFIIAPPDKQNQLCGLCGKYNFDMSDDFTMRDHSLSASPLHFGNSWKASDACSDVTDEASPCEMNPYRKAWSERKCSILKTDVFDACHSQVDHIPFYEACVRDSCACNIGGDCECFCTSVAAYAEACTSAGQCVAWRTPDLCPVFCDYYNSPDSCTWHYRPCGIVNTKTCGNPAGIDLGNFPQLEGCYPKCPAKTPYLDEHMMTCVSMDKCSCEMGSQIVPANGTVVNRDTCETCTCVMGNMECVPYDCCRFNGGNYLPGETIFTSDGLDGLCHFTAACELGGHIHRESSCQPTTPIITGHSTTASAVTTVTFTTKKMTTAFSSSSQSPAPTTTLSPVVPTTTLVTLPKITTISTIEECYSMKPPRQFMESWKVDNCTIATCNGGNNISYSTKKCSVSTKPKCRNAVMVYDADGCCYTWKCFCNCKGWGDPHIRTFDQVLYAFLEDCTYTLVEEKVNRHHLSIITDNFQFFPGNPASFPRGITVNYNGNSVNMSIPAIVRKRQSIITVLYNNELVKLPFSSDGIEITSTDVIVTVHIPAIYSTIVFTGQMYSIDLPYELFGDNTQGQCGTCNNQGSDDCVRKSGKSEASDCCHVTAKEWMVADPSKPHCKSPGPSGSVPCQTPTPTPTTPCVFDHELCKAIDKTEFSACLEVTSLLSYIETCKFDQCRVNSTPAGCPSIQSAADDCAMLGYYVDWRKATEGGCDFECPVGMEYKPAGPKPVASCSSGGSVEMTSELREGCICPEGTMICDHACVPLPTSTTPPSTTQESTTFTTGKPSTTEVTTPAVTITIHEPITTVVLTTTTLSTVGSTPGQSSAPQSQATSPYVEQTTTTPQSGGTPVQTTISEPDQSTSSGETSTAPLSTTAFISSATSLGSLPTTPETTAVSTTVDIACRSVNPPRQFMESWKVDNCTIATCNGGDNISYSTKKCSVSTKPKCRNAMMVYDADGCCYTWKCFCNCKGWGDPHIRTFDQVLYAFLEDCTYTLVEEKVNRHHLSIITDNFQFFPGNPASFPRGITVNYNGNSVNMSIPAIVRKRQSIITVLYNNELVKLPFSSDGIEITSTDVIVTVHIPAIYSTIVFTGQMYSIDLPYELFGDNTQGQCGTCNNQGSDDCVRKSGKSEASDCCHVTAKEWMVADPSKPHCKSPGPSGSVPCQTPTPTPTTPCVFDHELCKAIDKTEFSACLEVTSLLSYIETCKFDQCRVNSTPAGCPSIQSAADDCAMLGYYVDWRKATEGGCDFECPVGMEYKPAGPKPVASCSSGGSVEMTSELREGCFCPEGTMICDHACVPLPTSTTPPSTTQESTTFTTGKPSTTEVTTPAVTITVHEPITTVVLTTTTLSTAGSTPGQSTAPQSQTTSPYVEQTTTTPQSGGTPVQTTISEPHQSTSSGETSTAPLSTTAFISSAISLGSLPTTPETTAVSTTVDKACRSVNPPRQFMESWKVDNCTIATCNGGDNISYSTKKCSVSTKPKCRNAMMVYDADGCCYTWKCFCNCKGWGDPHIRTFDQVLYAFLEDCTYTLVEEKVNRHHLSIITDNFQFFPGNPASFPRGITVNYNGNSVNMSIPAIVRKRQSIITVLYNNELVKLPFSSDGIEITSTDVIVTVHIPAIYSTIVFTGQMYSIDLPYELFGDNTQGQCGTCNNQGSDDCVRKSGKSEASDCCHVTAKEWMVADPSKPHCKSPGPSGSVPCQTPTPTPTVPCVFDHELCKAIDKTEFSACLEVTSLLSYIETCKFDQCRVNSTPAGCPSIQSAADDCAMLGYYVDWRKATEGGCDFECPVGMEYKPAGPKPVASCSSGGSVEMISELREGCFCPEGTMICDHACVPLPTSTTPPSTTQESTTFTTGKPSTTEVTTPAVTITVHEPITTVVLTTTTLSTAGSTPGQSTAPQSQTTSPYVEQTTTTPQSGGTPVQTTISEPHQSTSSGETSTAPLSTTAFISSAISLGSLPTTPETTAVSTTVDTACRSVNPPRQFMESWKVDNCTIATCNGGDNISYSTKKCSVSTKPKCRNAMMVYDADGCCYTWKCFCNCKGWGDPHIRTFDQVLYAFLEDCTYTLVEEKVNRHHLSIITDNFQFFPGTPASFPRGITVNYNGNSVNMSIPAIVRKKQSIITVLYNNELVKLPFSSDGIEITSTDVIVTVHIPAIYSTIVFTGQMYYIDLPYELFGDNTQGQCGTCNNQGSDDCVRKSGKSEASDCCHVTAKEWMVADPSKPHCKSPGPSGSVPCQTPTPTPTVPCVFDHELCKAIDKTEFSACLEVTSLLSYIETCKFDQCRVNSTPAGCPSIQSAADDCAMLGYYVDWRKATEGGCDFECPVGMEYKPAGPKPVASCSSGGSVEMTNELREGCFCPEGTMICDHACVPLPTSTTPPSTTQESTTFTTGKPSTTEVTTPAVTITIHEPITTVVLTTTTLSTAGSTPGQSSAPQSKATSPYVEQTTTTPQSGGTPVQTTISEPDQSTSSGETSTAPLSTTAFISSATSLGSLPTTPETTAVSTTVDKACRSVNPPRQFMESWKVDNCTIATCNGGDNISYSTKKCSVSTKPKCRNAMMVYDADGCCYTWKCFCNCKGWGDPHIRTFDQVLYAFLEDCTYTLVEEKVNRHHLSIITDNFQFFPGNPASFPRGITVNYNGNSVNMSIPAIVRKRQSIITVLYNNELVKLPFSSDGIEITSTDVIVTVHIPAIYSTIVFTGQMYSIDLPYELFGDNTQGQCGTCNNQGSDDCVRKSGKSEASDCCHVTAKEWMVADPSKPHCKSPGPSGSVPCQTPTPTPTTPCVFDHELCKAIDKTEFSACLEVTSLLSYIETCKFDQCRVNSTPAGCPSIQSAADDCAMLGYYVDWRKATEGGCDFECPVGMEYKPAGPKPVASCSSGGSVEMTSELREGCICPEGTMICDHACVPLPTSTTPPSTTQESTTFTTGKPSTTEVTTPAVTITVHEPITTVVLTTTTLSTAGSTPGQSTAPQSQTTSPYVEQTTTTPQSGGTPVQTTISEPHQSTSSGETSTAPLSTTAFISSAISLGSLPTTPETTAVSTTVDKACRSVNPPRQFMESWKVDNCTIATCNGGDNISYSTKKCRVSTKPKCRNAKMVYDADGCCYTWKCFCNCKGWGDPHIRTFDQVLYAFLEDCTYTLVEEKVNRHHLSIITDNFQFFPGTPASFPRGITVNYNGNSVNMSIPAIVRKKQSIITVLYNNELVKLPFSSDGIEITSTDVIVTVHIPAIYSTIVFTGQMYYIDLPYELFGDNTQGQCGTCNNQGSDDCVRKSGKSEAFDCCHVTAKEWMVADPSKPHCKSPGPSGSVPCQTPTPTPTTPCVFDHELCKAIDKTEFSACLEVTSLLSYIETCKFDQCRVNSTPAGCPSIQSAADDCAMLGYYVDWRKATEGGCDFECPVGMEYKPAGPKLVASCSSGGSVEMTNELREGCFCPEGTMICDHACVPLPTSTTPPSTTQESTTFTTGKPSTTEVTTPAVTITAHEPITTVVLTTTTLSTAGSTPGQSTAPQSQTTSPYVEQTTTTPQSGGTPVQTTISEPHQSTSSGETSTAPLSTTAFISSAISLGSLPTTPETTAVSTTVDTACRSVNPPRQFMESWKVDNCTIATCNGGDNISYSTKKCSVSTKPKCRNAMMVYDADGCCYTWKCFCNCKGWGDPHIRTFDQVLYAFLEDCTYTLVEEKVNRHHLSIITDNFQFFPGNPASFPRGITVNYNGNSVNMSIPAIVRKRQSIITVLYNNELVKLPFSSDGIEITSTDVIVTVHIPAIYSTIVFTGQMYSIDLPYELFGDNTQGQCGTCNNQGSDDCVRKSGKSEASDCCHVTAKEWMVADPSKPHCKSPGPSGSVPCQTPTPTPTAPCVFDHELCKAIDKTEFSACLEVTSLLSYIETCKFDQCRVNSTPAGCPSIQSAADDCAMLGYYVDWRKATEGGCDFECPVGMEYKPAGPKLVASCSSGGSVEMTNELREGCFCPEGTMICDHACVPLPTSTTPPSTTQESTTFTTGKPSTTEVTTPAVTITVHEPITTVVLTTTTLSTAGSTPGQSTAPQSQTTSPYVEQTTTTLQSGGTPVQTTISEPHQSTSSGETSTAPLSTTAFISSAISLGSLPTTPETTAVSTTVDKACRSVNPPRQFMESWKVDNCTIATCNGGDNISYSTKKCRVSTKPKCRNAKMVYDADGCCYTWKCFCNCKGWGDPHIRTFDQVLYAFLEDCTYTLVEEKVNRHHLSIITDNFQFFPGTPASFPRGITVNYNGNSVNMSIPAIVRKKQSIITVLYNNELVKLPFSSDGIEITSTDVIVTVHIPAIYSTIVFTGQMYYIDLPYELFGDNTQGQCGTCNNQGSDDCVRKSGKSEASDCCHVTAKEWMVADPSKPHCKSPGPSGSVPCQTPTPTPTTPCVFDHELCKAIDKTEFSACLEVTSLLSYIETCKFDQCRVNSTPAGCPSIQSAADDCAMLGYYVDWRKATEGGCDFECPVGMEYKPAGPKLVASCSSGGSVEMTSELREGCFCPEGTMICDHACVPLPTSTTPPSTTQKSTTTVTFTTGKPSTTEVTTPAVTTTVHKPITTVVLTTTTLSSGGSTPGQSKSSASAFTSPTISHRPVSTTPPKITKASTTNATSTVALTTRSHVEPTIKPLTLQTVQATRPLSTSTFNTSSSDVPCVCKIKGFTAKPDGTLHVIKDEDGWCYYMSCSSNCFAITTSHRRCDTASTKTQNVTSQPTTRPPSTSVAHSSSQPSGCFYKDHHYKVGEKWQIDSCTTGTCRSGNQVMTEPVVCLNPPMPKCRNPTTKPVKVYDNNGCCYTWKCNCQCQGWGDPHYRTFDGQKYTFLEDCTYTLVEEKINKYAFSVLVDNYYFYKQTPASFVRGITVNYNGNSANISLPAAKGRQTVINKVIFNGQAVAFPFVGKGFVITNHETQILVEIPAIGASVSFTGMMFTVDLPYSLFGNNTQGQCGTCNNARGDDCMRQSGVVEDASCCAVTAADWMVPDASKPHCRAKAPTGQKPCPSTTPTTRPYCTADTATICDIITSNRAFAGCAEATDLSEFFDSCVYDTCAVPTALEVGCASLQVAAEQCAALGFYVDWRSLTRGMCQYNCSSGFEYQPIGPKEQLSCDYSGATIQTSILEEGCFCPKGMKMFNSQAQTCVVECGCMGPQGKPVMFGNSWQSDCKECVCDKASASVRCAPNKCPENPEHSCKPWERQELVTVDTQPSCCPIYACVPRKDICLYKEEMYQIGQTWNKPGNNCTQFICTSINELAVVEEKTIVCKEFDITNCIKDTVTTDEYGCCKTCSIPKLACRIFEMDATVSRPRCEPKNITLSTCEGTCASRTYFDTKTMNMASTCDCCKPQATEERTAVLDCKGVKTPIQYTYIKSCECKLCK